MRTVTHTIQGKAEGHTFVIADKETGEVVTSFTDKSCANNFSHVYMSADEARRYAFALIKAAEKISPTEEP